MSFDHIIVPRAAIPTNQALSFELFVKVGERFIKVANKDEKIDPERINRYLDQEKDVLFIDRGALERFMDERFGVMFEMISNEAKSLESRFEWFIRCLELGFIDLKVVRPHPDKFMRIELLVDWCYGHFRKRELRLVLLRKIFWNVSQIITKRAVFGGALALTMFMEQNDCTAATFKSLFTGALFRDISLHYLDNQSDPHILGPENMLDDQLKEYKNHPLTAVEMLQKYIELDDITRAIIGQHHEQPLGDGFPLGLRRSQIFQPAQYLSLADSTITAVEKYFAKHMNLKAEPLFEHLQEVTTEENQKNLPILLRVLTPVFD